MNTHLERSEVGVSIILAMLVLSGWMSDVFAGKCDNVPAPQVEIEVSKSEIKEAYDITAADLQRLAETTGKRRSWPGLWASSSDIAYAAEASQDAEKEPDGSYCATLAYVHVVIAPKNRAVHLAREAKEKPCLERAQKERLLQLAHADEQALDEFPIETEMRKLLVALRPSGAQSELGAKAQMTTALRQRIQGVVDKVPD